MATTIISTAPGSVVAVDTGQPPIPFRISVPGFPFGRAIITHAAMQHSGNFQFLHSITDFIYVYIFGDRIGSFRLNGMAFLAHCTLGEGLTSVLGYYGSNRIAARGSPVTIGFGTVPFRCFLTGGTFEARDQGAQGPLGMFSLDFHTFPT